MEETTAPILETKFRFREIKVYNSTEILADQKYKYRQVFDRNETAFVYIELSFYNKMFDIENWEAQIMLKCFSLGSHKQEYCHLELKRLVSKYDQVMYVQEGWGNKKEGSFWKKGTYFWEAWIDGQKVGSKYFYIEDAGDPITNTNNPYFDILSVKAYEGSEEETIPDDRIYLKSFSTTESRMIHVELAVKNTNRSHQWQCEIFFRFYNETHELRSQVTKLRAIKKDDDVIFISASFGHSSKGLWKKGKVYLDIVFLDHLIASTVIEMKDLAEPGSLLVYLPNQLVPGLLQEPDGKSITFDELMTQLNSFVGLEKIKRQVKEHSQYLRFVQLRKQTGFEEKEEINIHSVFIGNPGTGKTTIAGLMGQLYHKMGLLSKGHVHQVDRVDLVGEYIGQTAPKVKDAIEKARGGVLFIDEAYALARSNDDSKDFGREVIEILVKEMSNGPGDFAVIVAGYPKEMKYFLDSNPGLKSRFKLYYEFQDYSPQELSQIASVCCKRKEVTLSADAKLKIDELIVDAFRNRNQSFGNARFVNDLITKAKIQLGLRYMQNKNHTGAIVHDKAEMSTIEMEDVRPLDDIKHNKIGSLPIDEKLLASSLAELDSLIGMNEIKNQIHKLVEIVKYYLVNGKDVLQHFYMHTLLVGNPGTGKTTVARLLAKIYKALGVLERGHMVETDRQGLVAGFVGQSAIKTSDKIDEAMGGVLYIDEAYSLVSFKSNGSDYGHEVVQTLLKRMEDKRGEFFVFAAGYPDNMHDFVKANPGLTSRFDKTLEFVDYTPDELIAISLKMFSDQEYQLTDDALSHLKTYFAIIHQYRDKYFGNARTIRSVVSEVIHNQTLRLSGGTNSLSIENSQLIILDDVSSFNRDKAAVQNNRKTIGFIKS